MLSKHEQYATLLLSWCATLQNRPSNRPDKSFSCRRRSRAHHHQAGIIIIIVVLLIRDYRIFFHIIDMQVQIKYVCLFLMLVVRSISGHVIDQNHAMENSKVERKEVEPRILDMESIFAGFANSMMSRTGTTSSQNQHCINPSVKKRSAHGFCKMSSLTTLSSPCQFFKMALGLCDLPDILTLSLNLSNVVLMLVLKGLIWGASYMQGGGKGRKEGAGASLPFQDLINETDVLLFLGYLVADESDHYDCLNRVACEQPERADAYFKSAEMVWKTAKMLDGVVTVDPKYEKMLNRLQEAIEDGRGDGDCQAKYKCSEPANTSDNFNQL